MRRVILAVLLLGLSAQGWGATYYVDNVAGTLKYRPGAWPDAGNGTNATTNDVNYVLYTIGENNTVVLAPLTYSGAYIKQAGGGITLSKANATVRGPISSDPDYATHSGTPVLDGTGRAANLFTANAAGISISGITLQNADTNTSNLVTAAPATSFTANDISLIGGYRGFSISSPSSTFNRVTVKNASYTIGDVNSAGAALVWNIGTATNNANPMRVLNGNATVNNVVFQGNTANSITVSTNTGQVVVINNCMFLPRSTGTSTDNIVDVTSTNATVSVNNSLMYPNPLNVSSAGYDNGVTFSNMIYSDAAKYTSRRRPVYVSVTFDDWWTTPAAIPVAALADTYGMKITWFLPSEYQMTAERIPLAAALLSRGHELAAHSATHHTPFDNLSSLSIVYTGAGSAATMTISGGVLTTGVTGAADNLTINLASYTTTTLLRNAINATGKYTAVGLASNNSAHPTHFADVSGQDIKTAAYTIMLDATRFYPYEITTAREALNAMFRAYSPSYNCTSIAYPGGASDNTVRAYIATDGGYVGGRGLSTSGETFYLSSMKKYVVGSILAGNLTGLSTDNATKAQVKQRVLSWIEYLGWHGGYGVIYQHGFTAETGFPTDVSAEQWGWILEALHESNTTVLTFTGAMQRIAAEAEATSSTGGELAYTRSESHLGDASDYRPLPTSPLIGAGVGVGLATDYAGNPVRNPPSIGPYEDTSPLSTADPADGNVMLFGFGVSP